MTVDSSKVPTFEFLSEKLQFYQSQHNEAVRGASLDLVFFTDAMTHLIKVPALKRPTSVHFLSFFHTHTVS